MSWINGSNMAWLSFYGDFGGYSAFASPGARAQKADWVAAFRDMHVNRGAEVIRVWLAPTVSADGILRTGNCVTGVTPALLDDIEAVMEAANEENVQLLLCFFSFDCWTRRPGINNITLFDSVRDQTCRQGLMDNLVKPVITHITNSANSSVIWAVEGVNEIDWVMVDTNPAFPGQDWTIGDFNQHDFDGPPLNYNEALTFLTDIRSAIKSVDSSLIYTNGAASKKYASAWDSILDIQTIHSYGFDQAYFPISEPPSTWGITKPAYIGEFPPSGYSANAGFVGQTPGALPKTLTEWMGEAFSAGWLGCFGWAYTVDAAAGTTNGGYNSTTGAVMKAFDESLVTAATIQLTPTSASCDETDVMTLRAVNQFGVAVDSTNPSVTTGTFANAVYDPDSFQWTLDYTSPTCASGISDVTVSLDVNGVTANESLAIATCSLFSDDTRLTISQTNCSCETALEYIGGAVDIDCPRLGEVLQYRVIGCNCEYECGKPKFEQIHRTRNPVSLSGDVLSIGPLVTTELPVIDTSCEDC